jgi:glycosyltransferase involved in cell wall biosynthesis
MKILKIIHGYPPKYNAGSEVYSQMLCLGLSRRHDIIVLTREEDPFRPAFARSIEHDHLNSAIKLYIANIPGENYRYAYRNQALDDYCQSIIDAESPDLVHVGHLNHLSVSLLEVCKKNNLPIVFTLHDYWLMCPRGQFIRRNPANGECWQLCTKQIDQDCATYCYSGYFSGAKEEHKKDLAYWTDWISRRMHYVKKVSHYVDKYIAPSHYLQRRFMTDFVIPHEKIVYLDYGFDLTRFANDLPSFSPKNDVYTFGYIGTHIPAKGIQLLIEAFGQLTIKAKLIIWGKPNGYNTQALKKRCAQLSAAQQKCIEWRHEYANENIMSEVFAHLDCLVVPSIWVENSPLVIHEALQAKIPVITANVGGMAEYIKDGINGLLFEHRNVNSLAAQMQTIATDPTLTNSLGSTGYIGSEKGDIPSLEAHVDEMEKIYQAVYAAHQARSED